MIRPRDLGNSPLEWLELQKELTQWTDEHWEKFPFVAQYKRWPLLRTEYELMKYARINWQSPQWVKDVLRSWGFSVNDTRKATLQKIDHPAAALLLRHRELMALTNHWR